MGNNSENNQIMLPPLSEEQIERQNMALSDLWMLKDEEDRVTGPYSTHQLQDYSASHDSLFDTLLAFNLSTEQWGRFFDIPHFQRRSPQLINGFTLKIDGDFYTLRNGSKVGPYTLEQLNILFSEKKLKLNDLITADEGKTWFKLYEHHQFDRRAIRSANKALPPGPSEHVFEQLETVIPSFIKNKKVQKDHEDALVGLAFLGQGNDKGQLLSVEKKNAPPKEKKKIVKAREKSPRSQGFSLASFVYKMRKPVAGVAFLLLLSFAVNTFHGQFFDSAQPSQQRAAVQETKKNDLTKSAQTKKIQRRPSSIKAKKKVYQRPNVNFQKKNAAPGKIHTLDINDPEIRAKISRELANDEYTDEYDNAERTNHDNQSNEEAQYLEAEHKEYPPENDYNEDKLPEDNLPPPNEMNNDEQIEVLDFEE